MINPYSRSEVVKLLRAAADHLAQGQPNLEIHSDIHFLADHLEQED